jgi:hypothetical protein
MFDSKLLVRVIDVTIILVLQFFGVAAIWGYSEMFHWREHRQAEDFFRHLTLLVLFLGAYRCLLICSKISQDPPDKSAANLIEPVNVHHPATDACLNPAKYLTQPLPVDRKLFYLIALLYGTLMEILLQIFGTAAVWGSFDCFGVRGTADWMISDSTCRFLSYFFSVISTARYLWRIYKYKVDGDFKNCSVHYNSLHAQGLGATGVIGWARCAPVVYCFGISFCSLGEAWRVFQVLIFTRGVGLTPQSQSTGMEICSFLLGYVLHFCLRVVLEVLGAAGAIWGISEVLSLRTSSNNDVFSRIGIAASILVMLRVMFGFLARQVQQGRGDCWWRSRRNVESRLGEQAYEGLEVESPDPERLHTAGSANSAVISLEEDGVGGGSVAREGVHDSY